MKKCGKVWLAGAGPGDASLLTIKTKELLETVDVIVYDSLISTEIMSLIPKNKECIFVGKRAGNHAVPQEGINQILLEQALAGKKVLRLKGGDPFVFGRGGEELELLVEHGISFEIVPGITSAVAVAAYAGIPVTHRDYTSSFHVITGHARKGGVSRVDYKALVDTQGTLVFLMGIANMPDICKGLLEAGMRPDMPAVVLEKGTTSRQRTILSDVAHLEDDAKKHNVQTPAIIVVGEVCALKESFAWANRRPLGNRQFLITRPKQNSSVLAGCLRDLGAQVLEVPTISTQMIHKNKRMEEILSTPTQRKRWLVFSSPIGVDVFFDALEELNMDMRVVLQSAPQIKFATLGSATAKALKKYGWNADVIPSSFNAKALGECLAQETDSDSEIVILRAKEGSKELIPPLEKVGCTIYDVPTYETIYEVQDVLSDAIKSAFEAGEIDAVTFTSASTVRGFVNAFKNIDFTKITAVCIGQQTADVAMEYGMQLHIAKEASMDAMVELIQEKFGAEI